MPRTERIAIVGAGPAALGTLIALGELARDRPQERRPLIEVTIFEKGDDPGPGSPYSRERCSVDHLLTINAGDLSRIFTMPDATGRPSGFVDWLAGRERDEGVADPEEAARRARIYPRMVFGEYLAFLFEKLATANDDDRGFRLRTRCGCEVVDIEERVDHVRLSYRGPVDRPSMAGHESFDRVVVAIGHWSVRAEGIFAQAPRRSIANPWPAGHLASWLEERVDQFGGGLRIAGLGSHLTAMDGVLSLFSRFGEFQKRGDRLGFVCRNGLSADGGVPFRVTLYSRRGEIPSVLGEIAAAGSYDYRDRPKYLAPDHIRSFLSPGGRDVVLSDLFSIIEAELAHVYHGRHRDIPALAGLFLMFDQESARRGTRTVPYPKGRLSPLAVLRRDLEELSKGPGFETEISPWQSVLLPNLGVLEPLLRALPAEELDYFFEHYRSSLMCVTELMPRRTAESVLSLMEAGLIEVRALGTGYSAEWSEEREEFLFRCAHGSESLEFAHDLLVDFTGHSRYVERSASFLLEGCLAKGLIEPRWVPFLPPASDAVRAHLEHLVATGAAARVERGGEIRYFYRDGSVEVDESHALVRPGRGWISVAADALDVSEQMRLDAIVDRGDGFRRCSGGKTRFYLASEGTGGDAGFPPRDVSARLFWLGPDVGGKFNAQSLFYAWFAGRAVAEKLLSSDAALSSNVPDDRAGKVPREEEDGALEFRC